MKKISGAGPGRRRLTAMSAVGPGKGTDTVLELDDAVLVRRVAGSDEDEALGELYRRYAHSVYEFGLRLTGDRGLADLLVQETFLHLWRTADRFDEARGSVAAYLFIFARSRATDL